jgi:hypothetical protein
MTLIPIPLKQEMEIVFYSPLDHLVQNPSNIGTWPTYIFYSCNGIFSPLAKAQLGIEILGCACDDFFQVIGGA